MNGFFFWGGGGRKCRHIQPQNNRGCFVFCFLFFLPEDTLPSTSRIRGTWELWPPTSRHHIVSNCSLEQSGALPVSLLPSSPIPPCLASPRPHLSCSCQSLQGTCCREGPWESWQVAVVGSWQERGGCRCWGHRCWGHLRWLLCRQHKLGGQIGMRKVIRRSEAMLSHAGMGFWGDMSLPLHPIPAIL